MKTNKETLRIVVELPEMDDGQLFEIDISGHLLITMLVTIYGELHMVHAVDGWGNKVFPK